MAASKREKDLIKDIYGKISIGDKIEICGEGFHDLPTKGTVAELVPVFGYPYVQCIWLEDTNTVNRKHPLTMHGIEGAKYLKINGEIVWEGVKDFKEAQQKKEKEQKAKEEQQQNAESNKPEKVESRSDNSIVAGAAGCPAAAGCGAIGCLSLMSFAVYFGDFPVISGVCWKLSKKIHINVGIIRTIVCLWSSPFIIFAIPIYFILARIWGDEIKRMQSESEES